MTLDRLRHIDLFEDLTDEDLQSEVCGDLRHLKAGEVLFHDGDPAVHFYIVLDGVIRVTRTVQGADIPLIDFSAGMSGGEVPILMGTQHVARGFALADTTVFLISADKFWAMMGACPTVRAKVLAHAAERMHQLQTLSFQREKLVSLGTMAAGLAHELNNPASAARRFAQNLTETLREFDIHATMLLKAAMFKDLSQEPEDPFDILHSVIDLDLDLPPIELSEREDDLGDWFEGLGIGNPWDAASTLAAVGYTQPWLEDFAERVVPEHVTNFLQWMVRDVEMQQLSRDLDESTTRISGLVTAMKSYTYMDRGVSRQETDLHAGLKNTLTILKHRLRKKEVTITKTLDPDLPLVHAFGGELNQVWTNLLDNAIAAVPPEGGSIHIRTRQDPHFPEVIVEVEDNGAGIPAHVLPRIFEPFFTTKGVGEGTGLGLDVTHRIVVNRHGGRIDVTSRPGCTCFQVCLPIYPAEGRVGR
ncbi:MAG: ATP-binding protein [Rhodothermales bacterium]